MRKGFTLIELLVVILIISLLATVVLAALGSARARATDASIKTLMSQIRVQAELGYLDTASYDDVCDSSSKSGQMYRDAFLKSPSGALPVHCSDENNFYNKVPGTGLPLSSGATGGPDSQGGFWGAEVLLNSGDYFCVDFFGAAVENPNRSITGTNRRCN